MKNFLVKICISVLLISTVSTVSTILPFTNKTVEAANIKTGIFATPAQAKVKGKSFTTTTLVSRQQLYDLSTYLDRKQVYRSVHFGLISTLITVPLRQKFSITTGIGGALLSAYSGDKNAKTVSEALKKSSKSSFLIRITYEYRQTGSHDGYYRISNIRVS